MSNPLSGNRTDDEEIYYDNLIMINMKIPLNLLVRVNYEIRKR